MMRSNWILYPKKFLSREEVNGLLETAKERAKAAIARGCKVAVRDYFIVDLALAEAVRAKAGVEMTEERMRGLAEELIKEVGAFPDGSIISAYEAEPALGKLPDYVVARAIEETVR